MGERVARAGNEMRLARGEERKRKVDKGGENKRKRLTKEENERR